MKEKIKKHLSNISSKLQLKKHLSTIINKLHLKQFCKKTHLDKLLNLLKRVDKNIYIKILSLILFPIIIFLYSQLFGYGKIFFESSRMLLNFLFIYFIIGFFYCIFGKIKISIYISMILTFIIGLINYFVTTFRGTPLVPWDIFSINVALNVLPTFKISISLRLIFGILLFIIGFICLKNTKIESFKNNIPKKAYRLSVFILIVFFVSSFYFTNMISFFKLDENWDPKEEYHNNGLIASLFKQSKNLIITDPDEYNVDTILEIAKTIEVPILNQSEDSEKPNIIVIMNESFADLSVINNFTTNIDYMPFFKSLTKNTIKGNLHVSVFGATTPNTEWEFLTSNSMAFVPYRTIPYQQYVLRKSYSLATVLQEQGYTTSAIHSYYPQGYNRNIAYPLLGFQSFLHIGTLKDLTYIREYPDDLSTYKNIIDIYENKKDDEKMFNFTLTMQNHGSYTDENFTNTVIANNGEYPKLNQYLSLIKISDDSFKYIVEYFEKEEEHTIIVMFGDHQPYVEDEFYEKLLSSYEDTSSLSTIEKKYITPYIIWANYDINYKDYDISDISINYLTSVLLDVAELQKTPYLQFLDYLREEIPILTGNGYMDKTGKYHDFYEETEYSELINNYNYLQFNNMFDKTNKITRLFETPTEVLEK